MKKWIWMPLAMAACSSGASKPEPAPAGLEAHAVVGEEQAGVRELVFELRNPTNDVLLLLEVRIGDERLRGPEPISHACDEQKSTVSPGQTLHFRRKESPRPGMLEFVATYRRSGWQESRTASAEASLE